MDRGLSKSPCKSIAINWYHSSPRLNSIGHWQVYPSNASTHVPPFWHGDDRHSLMLVQASSGRGRIASYPGAHSHKNMPQTWVGVRQGGLHSWLGAQPCSTPLKERKWNHCTATQCWFSALLLLVLSTYPHVWWSINPDSKVHGAKTGPVWSRHLNPRRLEKYRPYFKTSIYVLIRVIEQPTWLFVHLKRPWVAYNCISYLNLNLLLWCGVTTHIEPDRGLLSWTVDYKSGGLDAAQKSYPWARQRGRDYREIRDAPHVQVLGVQRLGSVHDGACDKIR